MHEAIISEQIINDAKEHGEVNYIHVEVGDLAPITPDDLRNSVQNNAGWKVDVTSKKGKVKCKCGYEGERRITAREHDLVLFECPKCKEVPRVVEGEDIVLKEVKVKEG